MLSGADISHRSYPGKDRTRSCSSGAVDASPVDERVGSDWAVAFAIVLGLQEEVIFRTTVGARTCPLFSLFNTMKYCSDE